MKTIQVWLASAMLAGLAACGGGNGAEAPVKTNAAELTARVSKLETEAFSFKSEVATDIPALVAALPPAVKVTYDKVSTDASGATVVTNLKFAAADMPEFGLVIDEAKLWGLDTAFAIARIKGQQLDKTAPLARRIDAKGIRVVGLETGFNQIMASAPATAAPPPTMESYNFSADRYIFDDLRLRPYAPPPSISADAFAGVMMAVNGSIAFDTQATTGLKGQLVMHEGGQRIAVDLAMPTTASRGQRGFELDFAMMKGLTGKVSVAPLPVDPAAPIDPAAPPPVDVAFSIDGFEVVDARTAGLMKHYGTPSEQIPMEKDLFTFGNFKMSGARVNLGGAQIASLGEVSYSIPHTIGPTPTKLAVDMKDLAIDFGAIFKFAEEAEKRQFLSLYPDMPPPESQFDPRVIEVLTRHNLLKPSLDFGLNYDIGEKGEGKLGMTAGLDGFDHFSFKMDFNGVTAEQFAKVGAASNAGGPNPFNDANMALKGMDIELIDEGGLARIFAAAPDILAVLPEEAKAQMGPFANMSAAQLRDFSANSLYTVANLMPATPAGASDAVKAVAAFVKDGGKTSVKVSTSKPIPMTSLADSSSPPEGLTISSSHTPGK